MKLAIHALFTTILAFVKITNSYATPISTGDLLSFCTKNSPLCGVYLQGAYDGIVQTAKNTGSKIICARYEPTAAQLKEYFVTTNTIIGGGYEDKPAIYIAYVAFKTAMPCD